MIDKWQPTAAVSHYFGALECFCTLPLGAHVYLRVSSRTSGPVVDPLIHLLGWSGANNAGPQYIVILARSTVVLVNSFECK